MSHPVLPVYGLEEDSLKMKVFGSGLINNTWKIETPGNEYILQRINHDVFKDPYHIAHNISVIAQHLRLQHPGYKFVAPLSSPAGDDMIFLQDSGFFRLFPFVKNSHSKDVAETPEQAMEAALQFGRFTRLLDGIDLDSLKMTIPDFHNLSLRYQQFLHALAHGNEARIIAAKPLIDKLLAHSAIVDEYEQIIRNPGFRRRVTHHDTKISNILFDSNGKGICVIDLDTVMPGYFISDVGDMMRTYLSPVSEEEPDTSKIEIREDFYKAIVSGYFTEMRHELTDYEKNYFFYSGIFMMYMQAIRFLTDHLNNDHYYHVIYSGQNLVRATNQAALLEKLLAKKETLGSYLPFGK